MPIINVKKGDLLIAEPSTIGDVTFNKSIILLVEHSSEGSVGFILNKPLQYTVNDLVPDVEAPFEIYNGGPVEKDNLYFIHNIPELITDSVEIFNGIYWGGNFELTKKLINDEIISKNNIRFFLGYTGWSSGQLDSEILEKTWIISDNTYKEKIISKPATDFWKEKIIELGGDYLIWSNAPENPILN